jgi:hypothetical protein
MSRGKQGKSSKQGSPPKAPSQSTGGGSTVGPAGYGVASSGGCVSFFKRFFLIFAFVFIGLMIAAVWFVFRPRLEIVVLAVVLLALMVGGVFWLRKKRTDKREAWLLNETHDRRDPPSKPQEEFGSSLITQTPPAPPSQASPMSMSSENAPWAAEIQIIKDAFRSLAKKVEGFESRLAELEQERHDRYYSQNPKPIEERKPLAADPASPSPRRPAQGYNTYRESQSRPSAIDLSSLSQAVCRFLADQTGSWEIERLIQSVQRSMDGNASIEVEHLVPYSSGEWRLVALWPQRLQEGLVLVSSGELVDDDIARYFDVSYGRRIIACKQPARVSRNGNEVTVLQKGKVESS